MSVALAQQVARESQAYEKSVMSMQDIVDRTITATYRPNGGLPNVVRLESDESGLSFKVVNGDAFEQDQLSLDDVLSMNAMVPDGGKLTVYGSGVMEKALSAVMAMSYLCPEQKPEDLMSLAQKDPSVANLSRQDILNKINNEPRPQEPEVSDATRPTLRR